MAMAQQTQPRSKHVSGIAWNQGWTAHMTTQHWWPATPNRPTTKPTQRPQHHNNHTRQASPPFTHRLVHGLLEAQHTVPALAKSKRQGGTRGGCANDDDVRVVHDALGGRPGFHVDGRVGGGDGRRWHQGGETKVEEEVGKGGGGDGRCHDKVVVVGEQRQAGKVQVAGRHEGHEPGHGHGEREQRHKVDKGEEVGRDAGGGGHHGSQRAAAAAKGHGDDTKGGQHNGAGGGDVHVVSHDDAAPGKDVLQHFPQARHRDDGEDDGGDHEHGGRATVSATSNRAAQQLDVRRIGPNQQAACEAKQASRCRQARLCGDTLRGSDVGTRWMKGGEGGDQRKE